MSENGHGSPRRAREVAARALLASNGFTLYSAYRYGDTDYRTRLGRTRLIPVGMLAVSEQGFTRRGASAAGIVGKLGLR
jgi:hypothetical protein